MGVRSPALRSGLMSTPRCISAFRKWSSFQYRCRDETAMPVRSATFSLVGNWPCSHHNCSMAVTASICSFENVGVACPLAIGKLRTAVFEFVQHDSRQAGFLHGILELLGKYPFVPSLKRIQFR